MSNDGFSEKARGILKAVSYFAKLDDAALASVERAAIRRDYDAEQVILIEGEPESLNVLVTKAAGQKCERCWHWEMDVGAAAAHPTLCGRCVEAVK